MEWNGSDDRRLDTGISGDGGWSFSMQSWSPAGHRVVTHDGQGGIWTVDLDDTGALEGWARLRRGYFPTYAPVGADILDFDGTVFADVQGAPATVTGFRSKWSPDARQLVRVTDENLEVYDRDTGDITVASAVHATPGLTGTIINEWGSSWQRVAAP
jgi:hypothetical protein